jgi:hypothetical protein
MQVKNTGSSGFDSAAPLQAEQRFQESSIKVLREEGYQKQ